MYEIFEMLLKEKGVKTADVCRATDIKPTVFSEWKKGKSIPKSDKRKKIANFFGVSLTFLDTGEEEKPNYSDEMAHMYAKIRKDTELSKALMKYFELSDVEKKKIIDIINVLSDK